MPDWPRQTARLGTVEISFIDTGGEGHPVLLVHGFASTLQVNWINTGWVTLLGNAGHRVVAFDNRGHGQSTKFYDPSDYGPDILAADALALLDQLGVERPHIMGYSMGARISAWLAANHPRRVDRLVLSGMGANIFGASDPARNETVAQALETDDPDTIESRGAKTFRAFADATGSDRLALAACIRPSVAKITPELVATITAPTLVAVGTEDDVAGRPEPLADLIPGARIHHAQGRDHMKSVGDAGVKRAVEEFFS